MVNDYSQGEKIPDSVCLERLGEGGKPWFLLVTKTTVEVSRGLGGGELAREIITLLKLAGKRQAEVIGIELLLGLSVPDAGDPALASGFVLEVIRTATALLAFQTLDSFPPTHVSALVLVFSGWATPFPGFQESAKTRVDIVYWIPHDEALS